MNEMRRERLLVTVKTYPTLSTKYGETVCTAGVREDGSWIRLYPVPFRRLNQAEQYRKYDWLECNVVPHSSDPRPESFRPIDASELKSVGHVGTSDMWSERRSILLNTGRVHDRLDRVIDAAKDNSMSLCVFKPAEVLELIHEPEERDWDRSKLRRMREIHTQLSLFDDNGWQQTFKLIRKLPYSFSYRFKDAVGKESELQVLDWEIGALYWNCVRSTEGDERSACEKVRQKYNDEFVGSDLHFFLGTTQQWQFVAPNPWVIVGVLPIPHDDRLRLLAPDGGLAVGD
jgi:hypothetical protein